MLVSTQAVNMTVPVLSGSSTAIAFLNTYYGQNRPLRPYFIGSCLFSVLLLLGLFVCRNIFCLDKTEQTKQVIDIELMSSADYQDKKDFLPASVPKPTLGKRVSPVVQSRGELFVPPVFVIRSAPKPIERTKQVEEQTEHKEQSPQTNTFSDLPKLADRYMPLSVPFSATAAKVPIRRHPNKSESDLDIEEVKPPELVEIKENDGDTTNELWQDGGHSTLGTGTFSSLASYLKDLHKKLRQHWSPPKGSVRHIKVVFRLAKDGSVISLKLTRSSGNMLADNSALRAIKEASPFGKLPAEYRPEYLDLAYTFNYTSDELTEIQSSNPE